MSHVNSGVRTKIIAIVIGLAFAAGAALLVLGRSGPGSGETGVWGRLLAGLGQPLPASDQQPVGNESAPVESVERYRDPTYGFSFEIPEGFNVTSFAEGQGQMLLTQGQGLKQSFQIYIIPFDEPGPITPERIKKDLSHLTIQNPRRATLAGIPALAFSSRDPALGDLIEVWFAHNGNLYQVTAPAEFEEELNRILATFTLQ